VLRFDSRFIFIKKITLTRTQINNTKTGSIRVGRESDLEIDDRLPQGEIRWGFLFLNPSSGRFDIDRKMVDSHVSELRQQLQGKSMSIIDWIQGQYIVLLTA
jgi:hypothetical protein